jgi:pyruvate formate lyase activating enzyme
VGDYGLCRTRYNRDGYLYNVIYGKLSSFSIDYIEKTPLYHFYPNHRFLTLGSLACNLRCKFCLAWNITQVPLEEVNVTEIEAHCLVNAARALECRGLVYSHSEPSLNLEFYGEIMKLANAKGLTNVLATNGLLSLRAFDMVAENLDAVALTIKGHEEFYRSVCGLKARGIESHLTRLVDAVKERGIHLEIVSLVIPGYEEQALKGIEYAKRTDSPIIFLRFFPCHVMEDIESPSEGLMEKVLHQAYGEGLSYAYVENIFSHPGKVTYCTHCKSPLVRREGYGVVEWGVVGGKCIHCGAKVLMVGEKS